MDMVGRTFSGATDKTYYLSLFYGLSFFDYEQIHMGIPRFETIPVLDGYLIAISDIGFYRAIDGSGCGRMDSGTRLRRNIHPGMRLAFLVNWMETVAELTGETSQFLGVERIDGGHVGPFGCKPLGVLP